jgi:hypothetical protein
MSRSATTTGVSSGFRHTIHALYRYRAGLECYLSSNSSAIHSKHSPCRVGFRRFRAAMAQSCKIQNKGILRTQRDTSSMHQNSQNPHMLPMSSVKQAISQKIRWTSGMLVSAVALRGRRVSGLVGGYMCRQRTPAVETRRREENMRPHTSNFLIQ